MTSALFSSNGANEAVSSLLLTKHVLHAKFTGCDSTMLAIEVGLHVAKNRVVPALRMRFVRQAKGVTGTSIGRSDGIGAGDGVARVDG